MPMPTFCFTPVHLDTKRNTHERKAEASEGRKRSVDAMWTADGRGQIRVLFLKILFRTCAACRGVRDPAQLIGHHFAFPPLCNSSTELENRFMSLILTFPSAIFAPGKFTHDIERSLPGRPSFCLPVRRMLRHNPTDEPNQFLAPGIELPRAVWCPKGYFGGSPIGRGLGHVNDDILERAAAILPGHR